jgi:hypothetical protein
VDSRHTDHGIVNCMHIGYSGWVIWGPHKRLEISESNAPFFLWVAQFPTIQCILLLFSSSPHQNSAIASIIRLHTPLGIWKWKTDMTKTGIACATAFDIISFLPIERSFSFQPLILWIILSQSEGNSHFYQRPPTQEDQDTYQNEPTFRCIELHKFPPSIVHLY